MRLPDIVDSRLHRTLVAITLPWLGLLAAACSDSPDFTADEVLAKARAAMAEVESFRFGIEVHGDLTGPGAQQLADGTGGPGRWAAPDRWHIARQLGAEVIQIGTDVYGRALDSDEWLYWVWEDGQSVMRDVHPLPELSDVRFEEAASGTYHIAGLKSQRLNDDQVLLYRYDLFIDAEDFLLHQVSRWWAPGDTLDEIVACPGREVPAYGCVWTVFRLFGYGDPISIEPPDVFTERALPKR